MPTGVSRSSSLREPELGTQCSPAVLDALDAFDGTAVTDRDCRCQTGPTYTLGWKLTSAMPVCSSANDPDIYSGSIQLFARPAVA